MDIFELSNRFDVKLNSFSSSADTKTNENLYNIKLDEYEKSLLLTEAQNTIFKAIYLSGSETDESSRKALSKLLRVAKCDQLSVNQTNIDNSKRFKLPLDVAFINQENVRVLSIFLTDLYQLFQLSTMNTIGIIRTYLELSSIAKLIE